MYVRIMYAWVYARVRVCVCTSIMCVWLHVAALWTRLVRSGPLQEIRTGAHYRRDTLAIRRPSMR